MINQKPIQYQDMEDPPKNTGYKKQYHGMKIFLGSTILKYPGNFKLLIRKRNKTPNLQCECYQHDYDFPQCTVQRSEDICNCFFSQQYSYLYDTDFHDESSQSNLPINNVLSDSFNFDQMNLGVLFNQPDLSSKEFFH